ncbi:MAG: hypothetical protein KDK78_07700 [Chlamydiia bacterium]|nr:hypothetical protein [Chlamydiia bacterium]
MKLELFLDNSLLEARENVHLSLPSPSIEATNLILNEKNAYFTILKDNGSYRLYFKETLKAERPILDEVTKMASSEDGLLFSRPQTVLHGTMSHNFYPVKHQDHYLGIGGYHSEEYPGYEGVFLYGSEDGIRWDEVRFLFNRANTCVSRDASIACCDCLNNMIFDGEKFVFFLRYNLARGVRRIQTCSSKDLVHFTAPQMIRFLNFDMPEELGTYTPTISRFPGSNFFVGLPTLQAGNDRPTKHPGLIFSRDGLHWTMLSTDYLSQFQRPCTAVAGIHSSDRNTYLNVHENSTLFRLKYRKDGISCLNGSAGYIRTKPVHLSKLVVNYSGELEVQLGNGLHTIRHTLNGDQLAHEIVVDEGEYSIQFTFKGASLYSMQYS